MKYFFLMLMLFTLVACGQGNDIDLKTGYSGDQDQSEYEVDIPARSENEAIKVVRDFFAKKLDEVAFSGLYLERDPKTHLVTLIQEQYFQNEIATELLAFAEKNNNNTGSTFLVKVKPAKHSYKTLETIMNKLNSSHEQLLVTERRILSFGINEMDNRIDLHVSTKSDLNEELLNKIIEGDDAVIHITEGIMSHVDEIGIPTAEPYILGMIKEIDREQRKILIEDQIYFSMNDVTAIYDNQGKPMEETDLNVGDQVAVWTDGGILESLPAQGYAVVIQRH